MVGGREGSRFSGDTLLTTHRGLVLILHKCVSLASARNHADGEGQYWRPKWGLEYGK
jgi:hypothetical protein